MGLRSLSTCRLRPETQGPFGDSNMYLKVIIIPYHTVDKITHTPLGRFSSLFFSTTARVQTSSDALVETPRGNLFKATDFLLRVGPRLMRRKSAAKINPGGVLSYHACCTKKKKPGKSGTIPASFRQPAQNIYTENYVTLTSELKA